MVYTGEASNPQNIEHFITVFFGSFLTTWFRIRIQPDQNQSGSTWTLVITEATLEMLRFIGQRPYKATAHSFRKAFSRTGVLVPTF
jgi:hypothetical protein